MTQVSTPRSAAARARIAGACLFAALALTLAGCASSGASGGTSGGTSGGASGGDSSPARQAEAELGVAATPDTSMMDSKSADAAGASIIRTSDLVIEVSDPGAASDKVVEAIEPLGGRVEFSSVSAANEWSPDAATLTVRVPSDKLEEAISAISEVGDVVSLSRSSSDVTLQYQDLSARVAALETSTERLRALMAGAGNTADLIAAEGALTQRQAELDSLTSQRDYLENQVDEATITVTLNAPGTAPAGGPANFWEAILLGVSSLGAAIVGLGLAIGVALPWLVAIAVLVGVLIAIVRGARRRSRARAK